MNSNLMKTSSGPCETVSSVCESVRQHLNTCAITAVVAVVSLLTLAQPSEAKVVYIPVNVVLSYQGTYNLDLNNDGVTDFTIQVSSYGSKCNGLSGYVTELPASGNGAKGNPPAALIQGVQIGQGQQFYAGLGIMASINTKPPCSLVYGGPWLGVTNGYLGLSFKINGQTHYGWARLTVQTPGRGAAYFKVTLTGYAYENTAGTPINAGQE